MTKKANLLSPMSQTRWRVVVQQLNTCLWCRGAAVSRVPTI